VACLARASSYTGVTPSDVILRRGFLLWATAAAAGLWLPERGVLSLPRAAVLELQGPCSFCNERGGEVHAVVGVRGEPTRICAACLGAGFRVLDHVEKIDSGQIRVEIDWDRLGDVSYQRELAARDAAEGWDFDRRGLIEQSPIVRIHDVFDSLNDFRDAAAARAVAGRGSAASILCSFCGMHGRNAARTLGRAGNYICNRCMADAATALGVVDARSGAAFGFA
jgi:hypothetical protein